MQSFLRYRSISILLLALAGFLPSLQAATPSTKPVSATTQPIPKDWVKVENTKYNYAFYVPSKWKKNVVNDTQAAYFLPTAKNKKPPLFLLVGGACHETTVDAEAETARKDLTGGAANLTILKDQAATLGGQPAWSFVAQGTTVQQIPPMAAGQKPKTIKHKTSILRIVSVQGGNVIYDISFEADDSAFSDNLTNVQRVIDTFSWTAPPAKP